MFHTFRITDDEETHFKNDVLVISRMDSSRYLAEWKKYKAQFPVYNEYILYRCKDAPRR